MHKISKYIRTIVPAALMLSFCSSIEAQSIPQSVEAPTTREERKLIREGNKLYGKKNYAEAEVKYRQALAANADTEIGLYNLALSLLRQSGPEDKLDNPASTMHQADSIFRDFVTLSKNRPLVSKAFYNLGNIAFANEQYDQSIEMYKNTLRINPDDEEARENLRLAQKKLQQQQNQDQNEDKKDEQQKEQEEQQQQQEQQNQQQDQQQQQDQKQNPEQKQDEQQQQQQQQAAPDNSEQILNAVQNNERTTQQKVNAQKAKEQEQQRIRIKNQW